MRGQRLGAVIVLVLGAVAFAAALTLDWFTIAIDMESGSEYTYDPDNVAGASATVNAVDTYFFPLIYAVGMLLLLGTAGAVIGRPATPAAALAGLGFAGGTLAILVGIAMRMPEEMIGRNQIGYYSSGPVTTTWRAGIIFAFAGVILPVVSLWLASRAPQPVPATPAAPATPPAPVLPEDVIDLSVRGA